MAEEERIWERGYVDGCFDMMHFGHLNFLRQAKTRCKELYAGVHNDEEIIRNKGTVVFSQEERLEMVNACKWVAGSIPDSPYNVTVAWIRDHGCDACLHGDDVALTCDGELAYRHIIDAGMYHTVPRTKAISTTNLIGRILRLPASEFPHDIDKSELIQFAGDAASMHSYIPMMSRLIQFANVKERKPGQRIVYCDGTFDLLHAGHVSFLRKAKELGDYLVVGVHDDASTEAHNSPGMPIMTLQERVLNVLGIKYVDDVIIGAPYTITRELMDQVEPTVVVQGSNATRTNAKDAFKLPQEMGIYREIQSDFPDLTASSVVQRILRNYSAYAVRNKKREASPYEQTSGEVKP